MTLPTPEKEEPPDDVLSRAVRKIRSGYLSQRERNALATLVQVAGGLSVPTPIAAATFAAVIVLTEPAEH